MQFLETSTFNFQQLCFVLFDHAFVMVGRDRSQALWQQIVEGKAAFHFDDFSLAAQMLDVLDQQQFDTTVRAFGQARDQSWLVATSSFLFLCWA